MEFLRYEVVAPFLIGVIFMSAVYNLFIYIFLKNKDSIYYFFMQIAMVLLLTYHYVHPLKNTEFYRQNIYYDYLSLFAGFFATLFVKNFFNTKTSMPKIDAILNVYIALLIADMLYIPYSFIRNNTLYSISSILFLIIAILRLKEGFKPALFFFLGWLVLITSFVRIEYYRDFYGMDPMLFGSSFEAIMLALAVAYKVYNIEQDRKLQERINTQQNKALALGELVADIAHQWKQPLTSISYTLMNIESISKNCEVLKRVENIKQKITFLNDTMNSFINFYKPSGLKEYFEVENAVKEILEIVDFKNIRIVIKTYESFELYGEKNYFQQAILNILINSKEAFKKEQNDAKISICIYKDSITILDNARGIDDKELKKLFDIYYTTKKQGSGLGLYLTKKILNKFNLFIKLESNGGNMQVTIFKYTSQHLIESV